MRTAVTACRAIVEERTSSTGFGNEIPSRSRVPRQGVGSSPAAYPAFPHLRAAPPQCPVSCPQVLWISVLAKAGGDTSEGRTVAPARGRATRYYEMSHV